MLSYHFLTWEHQQIIYQMLKSEIIWRMLGFACKQRKAGHQIQKLQFFKFRMNLTTFF